MEKWKQFKEQWGQFDQKTKLMAAATIAIVALSFALAVSNVTSDFSQQDLKAERTSYGHKDGIPIASEESMMVTTLVDILANEEHHWVSSGNELASLDFGEDGFTEYNGDLATYVQVTFLTIEATDNGRSGTWRVKYPGGRTQEHPFSFKEDSERGVYVIESTAFSTCQIFEAAALGSMVF